MARSSSSCSAKALIFLLCMATFLSHLEGRMLLTNTADSSNSVLTSLNIFSALPKGTVPSSSPSKKGHATLDNEELFRRHLRAIDRILQSVPSPGVGH
ncbi:Precursor of CEP14 [Euphorbia peplus]|nr:Precursor of CEP14 [Euphorbia peplus]